MSGTAIAVAPNGRGGRHVVEFIDDRQFGILEAKYCQRATLPFTKQELMECVEYARIRRLNPLTGQVHFVKRASKNGPPTVTIQTGIDGFRVIAKRSGKYRGQKGPFWCGEDGDWKDVWLSKTPPHAAKVAVIHSDFDEPLWCVARFDAYVPRWPDGNFINPLAEKMGDVLIAKCAEAQALRKGFPDDLGGLYTDEEMEQADAPHQPDVKVLTETAHATRADAVREQLRSTRTPATNSPADGSVSLEQQAKDAGLDLRRGSDVAPPDEDTKVKQSPLRKRMFVYFRHAGISDRDQTLAWCSRLFQRDVTTTNDLSDEEVQIVIDNIESEYGSPPRKESKES